MGWYYIIRSISTKDGKKSDNIGAHKAKINVYSQHLIKNINTILKQELKCFPSNKHLAILDIGNSNGKQSLLCAQLFPKSKILVLDISKEAIKKLNANGNNQITVSHFRIS